MDNTPLPSTKGKRGKPLQKFDLELVEKLAARGLSYKQLAVDWAQSQRLTNTLQSQGSSPIIALTSSLQTSRN